MFLGFFVLSLVCLFVCLRFHLEGASLGIYIFIRLLTNADNQKPPTYGMVEKHISLEARSQVGSSGNGKEGTPSEVHGILSMGNSYCIRIIFQKYLS